MGRTVVGDEAQIEDALEKMTALDVPLQIGLLIGKLGGSPLERDLIYGLVPTPTKDGEEPASLAIQSVQFGKKKGKKNKSDGDACLKIDVDWVAEHACQVSRMLLGGMQVVGIYVFVAETVFKQSTTVVWQAIKAVAISAPIIAADGNPVRERLVLHILASPRRVSCRRFSLESTQSLSMAPCEWKLAEIMANLHCLTCAYSFDMNVPIWQDGSSTFKDDLLSALHGEMKKLEHARALINGSLVLEGAVLGPGNLLNTNTSHNVQLLLPFCANQESDSCKEGQVFGKLKLDGCVHAQSYAPTRESVQSAIVDLKKDIITSLRSRIELLCEAVEQETIMAQDSNSSVQNHPLLQFCSNGSSEFQIMLPRRILVPWSRGTFIGDYLLSSETTKEAEDRLKELFAMNISGVSILEPEFFENVAKTSFDELDPSSNMESKQINSNAKLKFDTSKVVLIVSIIFAIFLAIVIRGL